MGCHGGGVVVAGAGTRIWLGWAAEEVCGGASSHVVA